MFNSGSFKSRCKKWVIFKSRPIASKSLRRFHIPYALHVHVADFQGNFRNGEAVRRCPFRCKIRFSIVMHSSSSTCLQCVRPMPYTMSGAVHSSWNSPQRSDAVHSDVKFASASFIVMLLMHFSQGAVHSNWNSPHRRSESSLNLKSGGFMNGK